MRRALATALVLLVLCLGVGAHDFGSAPTWNREISRIVFDRCATCHRPGGSAFSLLTYLDAQPRAVAIKETVLARRMPPWGAVKGFGSFRNDQGLMQEQIELITRWVDGGTPRGNNPRILPKPPTFESSSPFVAPKGAISVTGEFRLPRAMALDGVLPVTIPSTRSPQIVAVLPDGSIEPLVWLYEYSDRYKHPFLFRTPVRLPAGSVIHGVPDQAEIALIPVTP
jgi:hypothetical protein